VKDTQRLYRSFPSDRFFRVLLDSIYRLLTFQPLFAIEEHQAASMSSNTLSPQTPELNKPSLELINATPRSQSSPQISFDDDDVNKSQNFLPQAADLEDLTAEEQDAMRRRVFVGNIALTVSFPVSSHKHGTNGSRATTIESHRERGILASRRLLSKNKAESIITRTALYHFS
jgi:hypothetical protein